MTELLDKSDHPALRRYALMMIWAFPLFFALLLPWLFSYTRQWWPFLVSVLFAVLYVGAPGFIYYPYRAWMAIAGVIGWINTRLILGFTFYALILPIGVLLRLLSKLQYDCKPESDASYYIRPHEVSDEKRLERPF